MRAGHRPATRPSASSSASIMSHASRLTSIPSQLEEKKLGYLFLASHPDLQFSYESMARLDPFKRSPMERAANATVII